MSEPAREETSQSEELLLPLPAIICIAIGAYIFVIIMVLLIRQTLLSRGICADQCGCCGKEGEPYCCECWIAFADSCNCCKNPTIDACLDTCCPTRKKMECADIIMCQCCAEGGCCGMCADQEPLCDRMKTNCGINEEHICCRCFTCFGCPFKCRNCNCNTGNVCECSACSGNSCVKIGQCLHALCPPHSEDRKTCLRACICCFNCCLSCTHTHLSTDREGRLTTQEIHAGSRKHELDKLKKSIIAFNEGMTEAEAERVARECLSANSMTEDETSEEEITNVFQTSERSSHGGSHHSTSSNTTYVGSNRSVQPDPPHSDLRKFPQTFAKRPQVHGVELEVLNPFYNYECNDPLMSNNGENNTPSICIVESHSWHKNKQFKMSWSDDNQSSRENHIFKDTEANMSTENKLKQYKEKKRQRISQKLKHKKQKSSMHSTNILEDSFKDAKNMKNKEALKETSSRDLNIEHETHTIDMFN